MPRHPHTTLLLCLCLTLPGCERDCERQGCSKRQKIDPFTPDPDYLRAEGHFPLPW